MRSWQHGNTTQSFENVNRKPSNKTSEFRIIRIICAPVRNLECGNRLYCVPFLVKKRRTSLQWGRKNKRNAVAGPVCRRIVCWPQAGGRHSRPAGRRETLFPINLLRTSVRVWVGQEFHSLRAPPTQFSRAFCAPALYCSNIQRFPEPGIVNSVYILL